MRWRSVLVSAACLFALGIAHAAPPAAGLDDSAAQWRAFAHKAGTYPVAGRHLDGKRQPRFINALIHEHSPYLLQHAHNPVAWRGWNDATLNLAKSQDRLIFLSIGYSTCHWCHVMARESFDSERIAGLLNPDYISIKVDREERPDLDEFFLARLEFLSDSPGWPMTLVLTPDGRLVAADSYLTEEKLAAMLSKMSAAWKARPQQVRRLADTIAARFARPARTAQADSAALFEAALASIRKQYDPQNHGFGKAPKFPNAPHLLALLDAFNRYGAAEDGRKFLDTLRTIAMSALHDPIDGGFFRYSVSADWQQPHFEKMLYDQALLARLFAEAWRLSGEPVFAQASRSALRFVQRRLNAPDDLFFSAVDAQSEGKAGAFYLWRDAALDKALNSAQRAALGRYFRRIPQGETGFLLVPVADASGKEFDALRTRLRQLRERRALPFVDRKAITAWNALMIEAWARSGDLLGDFGYLNQAQRSMQALLNTHANAQGLQRYSLQGQARGIASLEDGAHVLRALAVLFEMDGDARWHAHARRILAEGAAASWTSAESLRLFSRDREIPSASATMVRALRQLYLQSGDAQFGKMLDTVLPLAEQALTEADSASQAGLIGALREIDSPTPARRAFMARGHVRAELLPEVGAGGAQNFEIRLKIDPGWHVNSGKPVQDYLRATRVVAAPDRTLTLRYPDGKLMRLGFSELPLSVYEGTVVLRGTVGAGRENAVSGAVPLTLEVQACSDTVCLAPEQAVLLLSAPR